MGLESASIIFATVFLIILFLLHFLKRELDPSWRMISEYEIGRFGWLMRLAFFCWGASVLALLIYNLAFPAADQRDDQPLVVRSDRDRPRWCWNI